MTENIIEKIRWNEAGLIPAVAQQYDTGVVLMVAWMNLKALLATIEEGRAVYFSRSRNKLWRKGEESGHVQKLKSIRLDCDYDTILMEVDQIGGIACHTGRHHCFYFKFDEGNWIEDGEILKNPEEIYDNPK